MSRRRYCKDREAYNRMEEQLRLQRILKSIPSFNEERKEEPKQPDKWKPSASDCERCS